MRLRTSFRKREINGIGSFTPDALRTGARQPNRALEALGAGIQWIQSYVTGDKMFCVHLAEDEGVIRNHAERSGFPAHRVTEIRTTIDPTTASA
ncbi:MAG: DUF4242 domain-containing protein [Gammaproteobacteria bacterium]|nr:DUF4242 domain-containing protein [Gammaproteobacteria bacterium]